MLLRMSCFIFFILDHFIVNANRPAGISQNQGYSVKTFSLSQSSSVSQSSSYSSTYSSAVSTTPEYLRCNDRNATFKDCPNPCPGTCALPGGERPCTRMFMKNGCECKQGFYLNDTRNCVQLQDCPGAKKCSVNETFVFCNVGCPTNLCPTDDNRGIIACSPPYPCGSGCSCKKDYLRSEDDTCILYSDCPPINCTRPNEVYSARPPPCLFEYCTDLGKPNQCNKTYPNKPQCICKPGYYRNKDDICVPEKECPPQIPECKDKCTIVCPPQSCASLYTLYLCIENITCEWGCNCISGYLRNDDDICVPSEKCPKNPVELCGYNEFYSDCKIDCPPQTCDSIFTSYLCSNETVCEPGCNCYDGYLRNESEICVPSEECFSAINCEVQQECRPTCAVPNPPNCSFIQPSESNIDSCNCQLGFVLSDVGGKCIKIADCPANQTCNSDPYAVIRENPLPCPSTCEFPNGMPCKRKSDTIGCECKPGYLKSETGTCVLPDICEGGNPCGPNGTFTDCRFDCPTNYCPIDDSRAVVICETNPFAPCLSGCSCRLNYRQRNREDPTCILSSECPRINCTRQNEVWNPCPSDCDSEYCDVVEMQPTVCNTLVLNCNPKCVCEKDHFRNNSDICVSSCECRRLNEQKKLRSSEES